jgi:hypothetical protein
MIYDGKTDVIKLCQGKSIKDGKVVDKRCCGRNGLVKFYMPGCGGCIGMEPVITFMAKNMKKYDFPICIVDVTDPVNRPIIEAVGGVPYVPYICMFKNDGKIFEVESKLGGAHSIHDILPMICEITKDKKEQSDSQVESETVSKSKSKKKVPKNCTLCCDVTDDNKIKCKKTCS